MIIIIVINTDNDKAVPSEFTCSESRPANTPPLTAESNTNVKNMLSVKRSLKS